jgi:ATP-dependent RNA helicase DDX1
VPEKVWYCTVKGYKPWLEPDAANTRTQEAGGHTVWVDERSLLRDIEARLSRPIPALGPDLALPDELRAKLAAGARYGAARGAAPEAEAAAHLAAIRTRVEALARLEWEAQASFLSLKRRRFVGAG